VQKILLVDDDKDFVESNRDLLEVYGYEILAAYDGTKGLELAKREHPDLIVLDMMMTYETEGSEVAKKIREDPELRHLKILLVSGASHVANFNHKLEPDAQWLPVDRILEKPIDPARFMAEIERLLNKAS
jgi:two-component system, OmpR family, alkaline phosphatase synthesis response regulator PhoP